MAGEGEHRLVRVGVLGLIGLLACVVVAVLAWRARFHGANRNQYAHLLTDDSSPAALGRDAESRIVAFCGDCHAMPRADSFPRDAWHTKVKKGYEFYGQSGRTDLDAPPMRLTITYFRSRAPEQLVFPEPEEAGTELRARFAVDRLRLERNAHVAPAIAHLRWARLEPDAPPMLLACDMRHGTVAALDLRDPKPRPRILARLENPCHVEPCDLDGDEAVDLVVADLGSFFPADHDRGRVVWLRPGEPKGSYGEIVLASGLGRVADARPADFDADGDLDVIVADFGWHRTGQVALLKNVAAPGERPRFELAKLDPRPGTIHVPAGFDRVPGTDFPRRLCPPYAGDGSPAPRRA